MVALALTAVVVANSLVWLGSTVPGFFVLPNGIVSPVSLATGPNASTLFRKQILAVEGSPLTSSGTLYEYARLQAPDTAVHYTLRSEDGTVDSIEWRTRSFALADYVSLFGVYLLNGVVFLAIALLLWRFHPRSPTTVALVSACSICGVFFVTAVDRYDPHWFFGLHLMAEALTASALLHLALVFPVHRLGTRPEWVLPFLYLPAFLFGLVYQASGSDGVTYTQFHLAATVGLATGATAVIAAVLHGSFGAPSMLAHRQSALAGVCILATMAVAAYFETLTNAPDARVALDTLASASFALPLCIAYAAGRQDSFAIDALLRRVLTYTVLLVAFGLLYLFAFSASDGVDALLQLPSALPVLALCVLLVTVAVRDRTQALLDRLLFGKSYEVEQGLAALSHALASTHTVEAVDAETRKVFAWTLRPSRVDLFLRDADGTFRTPGAPAERPTLLLPAWRIDRLERGELQLRQEEEGTRGSSEESSWTELDAALLMPIRVADSLRAVLALGPRASARSYNADDLSFLRTAASQIGLAVSNASTFRDLEVLNRNLQHLNENLERQVDDRTAALHASNEQLNKSLEKLQYAYVKLEKSQANLLRSDRLATLGRLTAGLAHEMNTPLSAVLNSLKLICDLSQEYQSSIDDAAVLPEDHREIAAELISHAESAAEWANKATAFIRSVKAHGRDAGSGASQRFAINDVVADARGLVAHRLRAASCRIELVEEPPGITLEGDPSRFNQVLVNLLTNAIDAYEDRGMSNVSIEIRAWHRDDSVCVQVRDWAGGVPTSILPHIFDELYTTKGPGRGTGLGLWISRNIVEEALGGTLDVITNSEGSCFIAEFPQVQGLDVPMFGAERATGDVQAA
jgi:signal transduction histidine kinase